jgi:hypothetical protein
LCCEPVRVFLAHKQQKQLTFRIVRLSASTFVHEMQLHTRVKLSARIPARRTTMDKRITTGLRVLQKRMTNFFPLHFIKCVVFDRKQELLQYYRAMYV